MLFVRMHMCTNITFLLGFCSQVCKFASGKHAKVPHASYHYHIKFILAREVVDLGQDVAPHVLVSVSYLVSLDLNSSCVLLCSTCTNSYHNGFHVIRGKKGNN